MAILIEPPQNELSALQNLSDNAGFLKKLGDGNYSIDNNNYLPLSGGTLTNNLSVNGTLSGNGSGLTSLNASNISTGTLNAARLPASYLPLSGGTVTGVTNFSLGLSAANLHVSGGGYIGVIQLGDTATTGYYSQIFQNGNYLDIIANGDQAFRVSVGTNDGSGILRFFTANFANGNTERMRITAWGNVGIGTASPSQKLDVDGSAKATNFVVGTNQVVSARRTGWAAPTGTATRTTFATSTVTLVQLAERVKGLIDDLTAHGLIGA